MGRVGYYRERVDGGLLGHIVFLDMSNGYVSAYNGYVGAYKIHYINSFYKNSLNYNFMYHALS